MKRLGFISRVGVQIAFLFAVSLGCTADRIALLIGNEDYQGGGRFADLDNPVNDVFLVGNALRSVGFKVLLVQNADRTTMHMKLREFEDSIEEGGIALFYYAGHGIQFEGENYLIGTNALFEKQYELGEESVSAETVLSAITNKKPRTALVFLDCCRESPPQSWLDSRTRGIKTRGLSNMEHPDVVISFAAAPNESAMDGDENSPFAQALATEMLKEQELGRVLKAVANEVYTQTGQRQRPWWNGSLLHDFYFVQRGVSLVESMAVPSFAADPEMLSSPESTQWTLLGNGTIEAKLPTSTSLVEGTVEDSSDNENHGDEMKLPERGYFLNNEVFRSGPYELFNETTKRKILKAAQGKMEGAGSPDGQMGSKTQAAIIAYQEAKSLRVTGLLDASTIESLELAGMKEESLRNTPTGGSSRGYSGSTSRNNYRSSGGDSVRQIYNAVKFANEIRGYIR